MSVEGGEFAKSRYDGHLGSLPGKQRPAEALGGQWILAGTLWDQKGRISRPVIACSSEDIQALDDKRVCYRTCSHPINVAMKLANHIKMTIRYIITKDSYEPALKTCISGQRYTMQIS